MLEIKSFTSTIHRIIHVIALGIASLCPQNQNKLWFGQQCNVCQSTPSEMQTYMPLTYRLEN